MSKLKAGARRHKRPLTVRMLVAQISWLEGRRLWQDGRVVWQHERGILTPSIADIAAAQRCLNKIENYPHASKRILGDSDKWLAKRWQLLEDAKYLQRLNAPDLELLVRDSRSRNPVAVARLVQLLSAETACFNELPFRPSEALARNPLAIAPLQEFVHNGEEQLLTRVLGALVLGVLSRSHDACWQSSDETLNRAWKFGSENGIPTVPSLTAYLLLDEKGSALAKRCEYSLEKLPPQFRAALREMMEQNVLPQRIVSRSESAASFCSLAEEIGQFYRNWLDFPIRAGEHISAKRLAHWRQGLLQSRDEVIPKFWQLVQESLCFLEHPWQVKQFRVALSQLVVTTTQFRFDAQHLDFKSQTVDELTEIFEHLFELLRPVLQLSEDLVASYVELLNDCIQSRWKVRKDLLVPVLQTPRHLNIWFEQRWTQDMCPLFELLKKSGDIQVARGALRLNIHSDLVRHTWSDTEMYRYFVNLYDEFFREMKYASCWDLARTLSGFRTAAEARSALSPLLQALRAEPQKIRSRLFSGILDIATQSRRDSSAALNRLGIYIPEISRYAQQREEFREHCDYYNVALAILEIDTSWRRNFSVEREEVETSTDQEVVFGEYSPETQLSQVVDNTFSENNSLLWAQWTLQYVLEYQRKTEQYWLGHLPFAVQFSLSLADGQFVPFQTLLRRALRFPFEESDYIEKGLKAVQSYPNVLFALRQIFPRQPRRCATLLSRWGLTAQLGADILAPLQKLDVENENENSPYEMWQFVPQAVLLANCYCAAMSVLERNEVAPKGVLDLLETPRKLLRELSFLEEKIEQHPERKELQLRAETIRQRLNGGEEKWSSLREEIVTRMEQATAEAWLQAAEQQLKQCYRLRLKQIVGTVPRDVDWTDDLMNAALLWSDIRCNKKWLRRLIDAHLQSEHDWREKLPGNILFLRVMQHRGMNVSTWLSANAKTYRCSEAKGEKVHLQIENNPLHILQMGNYFSTCLSFGGMNSFSTVANACELNKRVIYATDGAGKVVGRKLVAINERGELVCFYTYTSLSNTKANQAVRRIFRRYIKDYAQRCNLTLASDGKVPVLFVDEWYNDGIVDWNNQDEEKTSQQELPNVGVGDSLPNDLKI